VAIYLVGKRCQKGERATELTPQVIIVIAKKTRQEGLKLGF